MTLEKTTERIIIRPLTGSDLPAYQRILLLPELSAANGSPEHPTAELVADWFVADWKSPYAFAVLDRLTTNLIGVILYYPHQDVPLTYDLGYFLDPVYWGRGLMPEAVRASLDLVQRAGTQAQVVWGSCLTNNHRSERVLEKLGLQPVLAATTDQEKWFRLVLPPLAK